MTVPEDIKSIICRKYSRPTKLSDPGSDFSREELEAIIHKTDVDLTDTDLVCIFQSFLPAGEYRESVYFLPLERADASRQGKARPGNTASAKDT